MAAERLRSKLMGDNNLYNPSMMGEDPRFGPLETVPVGKTWDKREDCSRSNCHPPTVAGIAGTPKDGAWSICMSAGYEDDEDDGDFFVYTGTGAGGQSDSFSASGTQVDHQTFDHPDNAALKKSMEARKLVRVVRGPNPKSIWAPEKGYRYDGLYRVEKAEYDKGKSGLKVCKYTLRREPGQPQLLKNPNYQGRS